MSKEPQLMHRFYSKDSQFLRGDDNTDSQVIIGQNEIYKYLKTVELSQCHARILLIDAQNTAHGGISVMVQGEVKYGSGPFRRFMQMFVLMPQGPNKYYVHNDMFRYQDQVFRDTPESDEAEAPEQESAPAEEASVPEPLEEAEPEPQQSLPAEEPHSAEAQHAAVEEEAQQAQSVAVVPPVQPQPTDVAPVAEVVQPVPAPEPEVEVPAPAPERPVEPPAPAKAPAPAKVTPPEEPRRQKQEKKQATAAAPWSTNRSFANLFKGGNSAPTPAPPAPAPAPETRPAPPLDASAPRGGGVGRGRGMNGVRRPPSEAGDEGRRRFVEPLPDTHQIFVGNLPTNMDDHDLREIFDKFGRIADIRINIGKSKNVGGPPKGGATPNFGFITFESPEAVRMCMSEKPICTHEGHRLNVEEKKTRHKE